MPLRAIRSNRSERDLKRRSTLDPAGLFKRVDRDSRFNQSAEDIDPAGDAASEDGGRPTSSDVARPSLSQDHDLPAQQHTPNTRRFSLMRFRHASDSQLSTKAKEHAAQHDDPLPPPPPVPSVPANPEPMPMSSSSLSSIDPDNTTTTTTTTATNTNTNQLASASCPAPAIITTAPTVMDSGLDHDLDHDHDHDQSAPKKRGRMQQFSFRRRSFDPSTADRPMTLRKSMDRKRATLVFKRSHSNLKVDDKHRDSNRPSTSERPYSLADARDSVEGALALPVARASESSRSDGSSGGHISFENTPRPQHPPRVGSGRFTFGRRSKQRASLFPLPMKIEPPQFPDTAPATPRASTGGASSASPTHSLSGSPPLTARRTNHGHTGTQTPPMPSASQVALAANNLHLASSGTGSLFRNDSYRSNHSARSSPNGASSMRLGLRGRSATMGSLGGQSDDAGSPTPPNGASGRNSTSTVGRSSFSNLFGLSARFRQNEPNSPRHGSPAYGLIGASGLSSHQNSFNVSRETLALPEREEGETPGHYLERIEANNIEKSVIASYLTKTADPFLLSVLRSYMRKFAFFGDPIDMAVRKLLMQVELPKETQQIDRVLQGFADRYHECNPGIFLNADKAYFISFSIIILHTDFFNKNNKRKMQRPDYIKNSSCEGVSDDALACFYDNVVYTPFIHIEDEVDLKNISSKKSRRIAMKGPMNDTARKAAKEPIDPYTLIFEGKLDALRPTVKDVMNLDDPYNYLGTAATLDTKNVYKSFSRYGIIQIVSSRSRPEAFMSQAAQENPLGTSVGIVEMPVTKVGILWRKGTKRKKARSPWQEWGAVLTRSGLSFFKNATWTKSLMHQHDQYQRKAEGGPLRFQPPLEEFKQDHIIPMDGAVALVDLTYKKHKNSFVICSKAGEETFLADSEKDLNEWLGVLNYTAAFETMGVRSRGLAAGHYEEQRQQDLSRMNSSHSSRSIPIVTGGTTNQIEMLDSQYAQQATNARRELMQVRISESEEKLARAIRELEACLRDARHLQILAPIQPKTRDQVIHAAGRLSAKLKWSRIEIWRMKCHRDILAHELEDEKQGAANRQARLDKPAEFPQAQLSPHSQRGPKIAGLARLTSKSSSLTSGHKPPLSPGSSARPGTYSSRDSDGGGEDTFKTPPESSKSSPHDAGFQLPPLSFSPHTSERRSSLASSSAAAHSPRLMPTEHRPSIVLTDDGTGTAYSDSDSDDDIRYTTPPVFEPSTVEPKTPEIPSLDGLRPDPGVESDNDHGLGSATGSPASRSKHRRSLHRTLRESSHRRSHKGRDSASTIVSEDAQEGEGLTREKGSFTFHGKKASVIQFGSDWHNTTAEERLKTKKQLQEAAEAALADDKDGNSVVSSSTATPFSPGMDAQEEHTPRKSSSVDAVKQRHVSTATITPASYRESVKEQEQEQDSDPDSDDSAEMSDIAEESLEKERTLGEEAIKKSTALDRLVLTSSTTTQMVQM